ncbi:MAG: phosphoribosylglycinamide formyltransferase [Alphaproteobacteria bacterium]|nr:MAG: phosphoribosylglycinamide formyltransferase [Alphaproteobacteria bacterium]
MVAASAQSRRLRLGVLISGRGSNMKAILDATADPTFPAEVVCVISNNPQAGGLRLAADAGIDPLVIDHRDFPSRQAFEEALHAALVDADVELVCLAGFMRLLDAEFVNRWRDKIVNIHPSLLPAYRGLRTHERVIADGVRFTGATVHFVRPEMDAGPIIVQAVVPVASDDTPDTLARRVLVFEHRIYVTAVRMIAEGRVRVVGERVVIDGTAPPQGGLINPLLPADREDGRQQEKEG